MNHNKKNMLSILRADLAAAERAANREGASPEFVAKRRLEIEDTQKLIAAAESVSDEFWGGNYAMRTLRENQEALRGDE